MSHFFHLAETPIHRGSSLIEASAGTGKTYTLAGIFLRLLIEEKLEVQNILVVTFTEAATAELRTRIREILSEAFEVFTNNGESQKPFLKTLFERNQSQSEDILKRLDMALHNFDEAAIYTIHGFCQRTLKDRAFESSQLFDTELVTDQSDILREVVEDFWRQQFYAADPVLVGFALRAKKTPDEFQGLTGKSLDKAFLKIQTGREISVGKSGNALLEEFRHLQTIWLEEKESILACFADVSWAKVPLNRQDELAQLLGDLESCMETNAPTSAMIGSLESFSRNYLIEHTKKKGVTPQNRFFNSCEVLQTLVSDYERALEIACIEMMRSELGQRKRRRNVQFFNDLLSNLNDALHSDSGEALKQLVRKKYQAALVDEFQDTDPVQYQIFRQLFSTKEHFLFLIGDPKQAIYGFRGADIFTYLQAAQNVDHRFTLGANWRSEKGLVQAVNTLFGSATAPFVFDEIQFEPMESFGEANRSPLLIDGKQGAPFQFWFWNRADDLPPTKANAEKLLPELVAAEISRLLDGNVTIGGKKLQPQDMAVLVLENKQAEKMQLALNALGIPAVLHATASVFKSQEAAELYRILSAISEPSKERLIKGALATDFFGFNATRLESAMVNEISWQEWLLKFRGYFEIWIERGFIQMFRQFLTQENIRERILPLPDGERRLTNVIHLSEILHAAAIGQRLGIHGLLRWFADKMSDGGVTADEYQLRLERDDFAVKIVTVHKSKGLEYPVVFCPFSWKSARKGEKATAWFHDADHQNELVLDLGTAELKAHQELELKENLAEQMRLLYVALTRARNRCYVIWGHFKDADYSPLNYLLHQSDSSDENLIAATADRFTDLTDDAMIADVQRRADLLQENTGQEIIKITSLPDATGVSYNPKTEQSKLAVREFNRIVSRDWRISSFSALTHATTEETPDYDRIVKPAEPISETTGIFAFPRGATAGTCLHNIFEDIDFTRPDQIEDVVNAKLKLHRFGQEHQIAVCENVRSVLAAPLDGENSQLTLTNVRKQDRLNELEFSFSLARTSTAALETIFRSHLKPEDETQFHLPFHQAEGFLKGFIDLVFCFEGRFYIVDWKSNWLGNKVQDYSVEAMQLEINQQHYWLQYHIYTLALHKYLAQRLPDYDYEKHFGGVLYVFLRGVDAANPGFGIYRDRPSKKLIQELDRQMISHPLS